MTGAEFTQIVKILKSNYRYSNFLSDQAAADTWFNMLNRFEYKDLMSGVVEYIGTRSEPPTVADLIRTTQDAVKARRYEDQLKDNQKHEKMRKCLRCFDTGAVIKIYPNGSEFMTPCSCPAGREHFPWLFMTDAEKLQFVQSEQRAGRKPVLRPFRADDDFRKSYLADTSHVSEVYMEKRGEK